MDLNKRIVELLALLGEYLQKTDRLLDRMDKHDELFERQFARMDLAYQVIVTHSEKIESLQRQATEIQGETREMQEETRKFMMREEARNDALMTEILSLSKRVKSVEDKF